MVAAWALGLSVLAIAMGLPTLVWQVRRYHRLTGKWW